MGGVVRVVGGLAGVQLHAGAGARTAEAHPLVGQCNDNSEYLGVTPMNAGVAVFSALLEPGCY